MRDHTAFKNSLGKLLKHLCVMERMREVEHAARSPSICRTWKQDLGRVEEWLLMGRDEMGNKIDRLEKSLFLWKAVGSILVVSCCGREIGKYGNVNMDGNVGLILKTELIGNCHFLRSG